MATRNTISVQSLVVQRPAGVLGFDPSFERMSKMFQNRSANQAALIWIGELPYHANGLATNPATTVWPTAEQQFGSYNPDNWDATQRAHSLAWVQNWGLKLPADGVLTLPYGVQKPVYWTGPNGGSNPALIVGWS